MVKKAVECRLIKSVFSLAFGQSNPLFFVISRAHDCLDALPKDRFGAS